MSWEVQKALAIQIMTSAMTELNKGIVDAAKFAAATTGFSQEVVQRWAYSYFTALAQYPGSLNDLDLEFIQTELSSERGKACGNPDTILHNEEFQLSARKYIRSNAYRKGEPNLTTEMFCRWVSDSFSINVSNETARRWLHYLGFNMNDHHKGVFFDGHDRDVVVYCNNLLKQRNLTRQQSPLPLLVQVWLMERKSTSASIMMNLCFFANADQTRFWSDESHLERASWCRTSLWKGMNTYAMTRK